MGRRNRGREEALFTLSVSRVELAELKRRATVAGFKNTSDWVRSLTLAGFDDVRTAIGEALDRVGGGRGCPRASDESDQDYRSRILASEPR